MDMMYFFRVSSGLDDLFEQTMYWERLKLVKKR
jgi:hypothetical protein